MKLLNRNNESQKEISIADLYYILGSPNRDSFSGFDDDLHPVGNDGYHPNPAIEDENRQYYTEVDEVPTYNQHSYIKRIRAKASEYGLELGKHVIIEEKPEQEHFYETDEDYRTLYRITVKNLRIAVSRESNIYLYKIAHLEGGARYYNFGTYLVFENNTFIERELFVHTRLRFFFGGDMYFVFTRNKFKGMDVYLNFQDSNSVLELTNNSFVEQIEIELSSRTDNNLIRIADNEINKLSISGTGKSICYVSGKNTVNRLSLNKKIEKLHWGAYQNIDPKNNYPQTNKDVFIDYIERAVKNGDKSQEAILRRELAKCEYGIIKNDSLRHSSQDRVIYIWGQLVSNHGISWLRPFLIILAMNGLLAVPVWLITDLSYFTVFFEFFNPLSNLKNDGGSWFISAINIVQKGFFALFGYEFIKVLRRFSAR